MLALYNLNGSLNVEGYSGDKVLIEVDERLTADDSETLEIGKKEFKLGFDHDRRQHHRLYCGAV